MISVGELDNICIKDIYSQVSDFDIINYYFGVSEVPCLINSPLRRDNNASLGFYSKDGKEILWTDFATKQGGNIISLLSKFWGESYANTKKHLWEDLSKITNTNSNITIKRNQKICKSKNILLECKTRKWESYDIQYWKSYGVTLEWLKYANVYPISHIFVTKDNVKFTIIADKYAYAYVEFKEGKTTIKVYQPFNDKGFKWSNNHDKSVISLWTKVPKFGNKICICSSLKDALCLWNNTGMPSLAVQGEGYSMSDTAITNLKKRFKNVYILYDNDDVGIADGLKLAKETGFTNVVLPKINGAKDISDLYKSLNDKKQFKQILLNLFKI